MLKRLSISDFPKVYELMEQSFPTEEYRSYEGQLALLNHEGYKIYGEIDDGGELRAFLAVWELTDYLFIEHFAVRGKDRNKGLGSVLLQEMRELYNVPHCLEVELPEGELSRRRIGFYERNGFYLNRFPYEQPPLGPGRNAVPLHLMTTGKTIGYEEFRSLKEELYNVVYGMEGSV